ncbi:MAG TPA: YncE family protein [Terriglobia bacterium]|nr:YncE family protein [Terriglobia bacterium]
MKRIQLVLLGLFVMVATNARAQGKALELIHTTPLPELHDGDFDHAAIDLKGHRLFFAAEENSKVLVFDTNTNQLIHTFTDMKAPHSIVYRPGINKLFIVDGEASEIKIYQGDTYRRIGQIPLSIDCDSMAYDPATKYMYVVNGGREAHTPYSLISIIDTTTAKKLGDIKINSNRVEALALEKSGDRLYCNITGENAVGEIDRKKRVLMATWPIASQGKQNVPLAYDEADHRLFVVTREPGKLIVLDSDSGKVVTSMTCVGFADDAVYDPGSKRIYVAGDGHVDVFAQKDADHYTLLESVPGSFRAKTALLVPQLHRYYLGVAHHDGHSAALRVYKVL